VRAAQLGHHGAAASPGDLLALGIVGHALPVDDDAGFIADDPGVVREPPT